MERAGFPSPPVERCAGVGHDDCVRGLDGRRAGRLAKPGGCRTYSMRAKVGSGLTIGLEDSMRKNTEQKKQKCKNCEGKGTLKKGDKIVRCQRCGGTGIKGN